MTSLLPRETLTGVRVVEVVYTDDKNPRLRADVRVLGRRWEASATLLRLEEHTAGARWWAWAEGYLEDAYQPFTRVVGVRVGPVGMPSRRGAIRDALTEVLSQLQACAWAMVEDES